MTTKVYSGGTWNNVTKFSVRNSGTWQEADTVYQKRSGTWEVIYDKGPYVWSGGSVGSLGVAEFGQGADTSAIFGNDGILTLFAYPLYIGDDTYRYAPLAKVSSLEIRYDPVSIPSQFTGDSTGVWLSLSTSRVWGLSLPSGIINSTAVTGTLSIRRDDLLVASGILSMSAEVISIG